LQAGGRRFDPDWLHQTEITRLGISSDKSTPATNASGPNVRVYWWLSVAHRKMAMSLFKNSEVVLTLMIQAKLILFELISLKRIMSHLENQ
jgi:hypothetical protein